jgi:hypothetical protein
MFPTPWTRKTIALSLLLLASSCGDILDLYEAVKDYGYRANQPLGAKKVPVNETFLGAYVYEQLPVIVSKKDELTYHIKFLHTRLGNENRSVDAFASQLGGFTFLNLQMGDFYCFVRMNTAENTGLVSASVLLDGLERVVPQDKIRAWLAVNAGTDQLLYKNENGEEKQLDLYFNIDFKRIIEEEALAMQEEELYNERLGLFTRCYSYEQYKYLLVTFPGDELQGLAVEALFNRCNTIEEYQQFIVHFPGSALAEVAEASIRQIIQNYEYADALLVDEAEFDAAVAVNSIEGYDKFYYTCQTDAYRDSALRRIDLLASNLQQRDIEKEWESENHHHAIRLLFYKIEYMDNNKDLDWIIDLALTYPLVLQDKELYQEALIYLDLLLLRNVTNDQYLNIYRSKILLLWADYDIEQLFELYEPRIADTYDSGLTFKDALKEKYKSLEASGIVFPNQDAVWKKMKKMKVID